MTENRKTKDLEGKAPEFVAVPKKVLDDLFLLAACTNCDAAETLERLIPMYERRFDLKEETVLSLAGTDTAPSWKNEAEAALKSIEPVRWGTSADVLSYLPKHVQECNHGS